MNARDAWHIVKNTFKDFTEDNAFQLGAALSFYALLSLAPLLIVLIGAAGLALGEQEAREKAVSQVQTLVGEQGAEVTRTILQNASMPRGSIIAIVIGVVTLLVGATGVFVQLQSALDQIWDVEARPGLGIWGVIRTRLLSLLMLLLIGAVLLASLVVSAVLTTANTYLADRIPGLSTAWSAVNFVVSLLVTTLLFALIFKLLPDVQIRWKDVWIGALVTGFLFTIGKTLIGLYLGYSSVGSVYGAAGSLVALIVWVYYSSLIFFLGAEFTQVYARRYGTRIQPSANAIPAHDRRDRGDEGRLAGAH